MVRILLKKLFAHCICKFIFVLIILIFECIKADNLNEQIKQVSDQIKLFDAQVQAQTSETQTANSMS